MEQADGQIIQEAPLWTPAAVVGNIQPGDGRGTFFTRFGDWLAYGCVLIVLACVLQLRRTARA